MNIPTEFLFLLLASLFILSAFLVFHFASPNTSLATKFFVVISFGLGFAGVALLPVDLTVTTFFELDNDRKINPNATYGPWQVIYWSTFLLGYVLLPLVRESLLSGHFTFQSRLQAGCRAAVKGYLVIFVAGLVGVVFMVIQLHSWHVVPVLMAIGNTYGLLLVSLLLGYGLVDLPRKIWRQANPTMELRRTQIIASNADEHLFEAVWDLQDCEAMIDNAAVRIGDYEENGNRMLPMMDPIYAQCVDKLLTLRKTTAVLSPELQRRRTTNGQRRQESHSAAITDEGYPTIEYLAKLNRRLQNAQNEVLSAEQRWYSIVKRSEFYGELVEGSTCYSAACEPTSKGNLELCIHLVSRRCRYVWLRYIRNHIFRFLGFLCAILSVMVLWSEATLWLPFNASPFALLLRWFDKTRGLLFQLSALIPFLYMSICVYSSLFKLSLFGPYKLRGRKMSSGVSLIFNAQYLVRMQFPLGYNYLFMIKYDTSSTDCAFAHVMSHMETVPFFGTSFSIYAPLLILALCGFTLCNGYARLLAFLRIDHEDAILLGDQETLQAKVNEGITLLRRSGVRHGCSPIPKRDSSVEIS